MNFKKSFIMIVIFTVLFGCASTHRIPTISDSEAFKYEKKYLAEYESLKNNYSDTSEVKWIQAANKCVPCKMFVAVSKHSDRTLDENFKIFWDGECKNGYANGLGREFERGTVLNTEALAIYQGKPVKPKYYIQTDNLDNITMEGDLNNRYFVKTTITDENLNFDIVCESGFMGSPSQPFRLVTLSSPFSDNILLKKQYPNFVYELFDYSNNEFNSRKFNCRMRGKNNAPNGFGHGFGFTTQKSGQLYSGEAINGKLTRTVKLPDSYFNKIGQIFNEVAQATQKAKDAQKESLRVKKQYINRICKDSVHVTFIDNIEYKAICNEGEGNINLKNKIENKLAQISSQKQQKREQLNQQKIIDAQVAQANAAKRQANSAARSAKAAERANNLQSSQNTNQSMQQTNSYLYPSITPFSGFSYSNNRKIKNCYTVGGIEFCR